MKGKEILKRSGGITLIALVITIIVLLILAGVTIATLTGDNGLLTKAGNTKNTANEAEIEEKLKLAYQDYYLGQHTEAGYTFQNAVDKMFGEGVATVTESNDVYKVTFINGKKYTFNALTKEVAELEEIWTQDGTTITNTKTGQVLEVGDTVYYDSGVAAYEGTGDNQGKWGILGAENGKLLIMSKSNVAEIVLSGKQDWLTDGTTKLNNACSSFKNISYADSVRSVKVEDINKLTGVKPAAPVTYSYTLVNGYVKREDKNPSTWAKTFEDINGNKLSEDSQISVTHDGYTYNFQYYGLSAKVHQLIDGGADGRRYFMNTRFVGAYQDYASWRFFKMDGTTSVGNGELYTSLYGDSSTSSGVRAVVSLKTNIKLVEGNDGWTLQQ